MPARASASPADLRLSRELLRHLPSGVIFLDAQARVDGANPAAAAALGFEHPIGRSVAEIFGQAELCDPDGTRLGSAAAVIEQAGQHGTTLQRKVLRHTTPSGEVRHLGVTLFPVPSPPVTANHSRPGEPASSAGSICLLTDLTSVRQLEDELQRRKSLSALGEMAAGISHEFKNSLATISGYAQMLRAELQGDAREKAAKILEQTAMLSDIATDFLTFARPLELQTDRLDLGPLLRRCAEAVWVQDFPQVVIALEGPFPAIIGDAVPLEALIRNLLRNGCEAIVQSHQGSHVRVHPAGREGTRVRLQFTDDGPGVAAAIAEKIFIPFFTTKSSGTGLGLAMAHKIATAHQGSLRLAATAPGHTTFELLLPAAPEEPGD